MKHGLLFIVVLLHISQSCFCQQKDNSGARILFHGVVMDANTFAPVSNSQILINRAFTSVSGIDGSFDFFVNRADTVLFRHIGYKPTTFFVSDTLAGKEFMAGIFLKNDTVSIGEVVIVPRFINIKSEILNAPSKIPATMDNARYNVAISGYAGRTNQGKLGDPASNYGLLRERQKIDAYEKGGIPSDRIAGLNPMLLLPAAYLLIRGAPEKPEPYVHRLTDQELEKIMEKYQELQQQNK